MNSVIKQGLDYLTALLSPPFCSHCSLVLDQRYPLCAQCSESLKPIVSVSLPLTKKYSLDVHAVAAYDQPLRSLILAKNYGNRVASMQLATLIWQHTHLKNMSCDMFVPIPLHWRRYAWRGFNQSAVMAEVLTGYCNVPTMPIIKRQRATFFQAELNSKERAENVKAAFYLDPAYAAMKGKHIMLVDDLMTTGSTLKEAAKTLLPLSPASITAIVACRVI